MARVPAGGTGARAPADGIGEDVLAGGMAAGVPADSHEEDGPGFALPAVRRLAGSVPCNPAARRLRIAARGTARRLRALGLALALWVPAAAAAQDLPLPPGAQLTAEVIEPEARYALPTDPWTRETGLPVAIVEGPLSVRAWRIPGSGATPQQVLRPLRAALQAQGWEILLDCADTRCGGFDFRFATLVLPGPDMYVDLGRFRFLSARGPAGGAVSVLTSRDEADAYLQIVAVSAGAPDGVAAPAAPAPAAPGDLIARLEARGHVVLPDLDFASGRAGLGGGPVESLDRLARYLADNPDRRILFVGHTDATGSLDANRRLSRARAEAALAYMADRHGLGPDRVEAEGAGYLAPVASNLDAAGREANRRVEAILLPAE